MSPSIFSMRSITPFSGSVNSSSSALKLSTSPRKSLISAAKADKSAEAAAFCVSCSRTKFSIRFKASQRTITTSRIFSLLGLKNLIIFPPPRRSKLRSVRNFLAKISHNTSLLLLFRKKSRSAHLFGCKRPLNGSLSLTTFCEYNASFTNFAIVGFAIRKTSNRSIAPPFPHEALPLRWLRGGPIVHLGDISPVPATCGNPILLLEAEE